MARTVPRRRWPTPAAVSPGPNGCVVHARTGRGRAPGDSRSQRAGGSLVASRPESLRSAHFSLLPTSTLVFTPRHESDASTHYDDVRVAGLSHREITRGRAISR